MGKAHSSLNIFEYETVSREGLRALIFIPVGYNSSSLIDPWHPSLI